MAASPMPTGPAPAANPLAGTVVPASAPTQRPGQAVTAGASRGPGPDQSALGLPHAQNGLQNVPGAPFASGAPQQSGGTQGHQALMAVLQQLVNSGNVMPGTSALFNYAQASDRNAAAAQSGGPGAMQSLRQYLTSPDHSAKVLPQGQQLPYGASHVPPAASPQDVGRLQHTTPPASADKLDIGQVDPSLWTRMSSGAQQVQQNQLTQAGAAQAAPTRTAGAPTG